VEGFEGSLVSQGWKDKFNQDNFSWEVGNGEISYGRIDGWATRLSRNPF